jgi:uncharacterized lipoprotein
MKSIINKLLILSSTVLVFACSVPVKHVIVSPELNMTSSNAFQQKQVNLRFQDLRPLNHIVQISRLDQAAELYSPQLPLIEVVERELTSALKANGLQIQPLAANQVDVIIDSALVSVQQELLKYSANNLIDFRVVITSGQGTLTKSFKISGNSNGPLKADLPVLERDFNQQLAKLLSQIVQSEELQQFIQ